MGYLCDYLTRTYFETTNPKAPYSRIVAIDVVVSIILHTIAYMAIIYGIGWLFNIKTLLNKKVLCNLTCVFLIIMTCGYFGRLMRVKAIYNYYKKHTPWNDDHCVDASNKLLDKGYFRFYFMG